MSRPLKGAQKRVKFTTTVDPSLIALARECASAQHLTLPALIEQLLEAEIKRRAAESSALAAVAELASQSRATRRSKGR